MDQGKGKKIEKKAFEKDERNAGGRRIVEANMKDYLAKVEKAKGPVMLDVKKNQPPVHINEKSGKNKDILKTQTQERFDKRHQEKLQKAKKTVDVDVPVCDKAKEHLKGKNKREKKHEEAELMREWTSMTRRIAELGNENDRKKNIHDPFAYPPVIFERKEEPGVNSGNHFFNYKTGARVGNQRDVTKIKEKLASANDAHKQTIKEGKPREKDSKKPEEKGRSNAISQCIFEGKNEEETREKTNGKKRDLRGKNQKEIRDEVVGLIIKERTYKKEEFMDLFQGIRDQNPKIGKEIIAQVQEALYKEMEFD